jgi:hypothetical protein
MNDATRIGSTALGIRTRSFSDYHPIGAKRKPLRLHHHHSHRISEQQEPEKNAQDETPATEAVKAHEEKVRRRMAP